MWWRKHEQIPTTTGIKNCSKWKRRTPIDGDTPVIRKCISRVKAARKVIVSSTSTLSFYHIAKCGPGKFTYINQTLSDRLYFFSMNSFANDQTDLPDSFWENLKKKRERSDQKINRHYDFSLSQSLSQSQIATNVAGAQALLTFWRTATFAAVSSSATSFARIKTSAFAGNA